MINKACKQCKKIFKTYPSLNKLFCCKKCYTIWQKGKHISPKTEFKKGRKVSLKERQLTSKRLKGKPTWNKGKSMENYPQCGWQKGSKANTGDKNPMWNGGKRITHKGYIIIYSPNHPNRNCLKCVLEHRLIAERYLKRFLTSTEIIHHINGIKTDNRIENLYLFPTAGEHNAYHNFLKNSNTEAITKSNLVQS